MQNLNYNTVQENLQRKRKIKKKSLRGVIIHLDQKAQKKKKKNEFELNCVKI